MKRIFEILMVVILLFAIKSTIAQEKAVSKTEQTDEYIKAIGQYYEFINNKNYLDAYKMLSDCRIALYNADGSRSDFYPRQDYDLWLKNQKYIDSIVVFGIKRGYYSDTSKYAAVKGNAEATLGIRKYKVNIHINYSKNFPGGIDGGGLGYTYVIVVKGNDDRIRILRI
jgi:uncharacterized protein YxeA